ncbi:MAG TPA: TonB-dependent receptor [Terriglobia bacterium]|nr:TonB-dependent receptor [Terriglobia bacterium]
MMLLVFVPAFALPIYAQITIDGRVLAGNGAQPLAGVQVVLQQTGGKLIGETYSVDDGSFTFPVVEAGDYRISATKEGFFALQREISLRSSTFLELDLSRKPILEDSISVPAQVSHVELQGPKPEVRDTLTYEEIQLLPAGNSRNFLNSLPLSSSVVEGRDGNLHIRGASSQNIQYQIDGINVTDPVKGGLQSTISSDAVENVDVVASGYAPEYERSAGGLVRLETRAPADRWQHSLTDMLPNYSFHQQTISEFTPRLTLRGPIGGKRLNFMYGLSGEYRKFFDDDLPRGTNAQRRISGDHVIRTRYTFSDLHLMSATILINHQEFRNAGLNREAPIETTTDLSSHNYAFGLTDRLFFNATTLLESMVQFSGQEMNSRAKGSDTYRIWPNKRRGNFYLDEGGKNHRRQWNETFAFSIPTGHLTHQVKAGAEASFKYYDPRIRLRPFEFYRVNGSLLRKSSYEGGQFRLYSNREMGFFIQDTILVRPGLTATYGFRMNSDQTHEHSIAPRIGATWYPGRSHRTRIGGGLGYFYDRLLLSSLIQDQFPRRTESVFADDGSTVIDRYVIRQVPPVGLRTPVSKNLEVGIEREIVPQWVVRASYMRRSGWRELQQIDIAPSPIRDKEAWLAITNTGVSEYRAFDVSTERSWGQAVHISLAYTLSQSLQSLRVDPFALNIQPQVFEAAPTDWDAPHRFVGWAMFPFFNKSRAGIMVETHSGFPFSVQDEYLQILGHRNGRRFPLYFSMGLSLEREFPLTKKYRVGVRVSGFDLTNHFNPTFVDSNLDSPDFLAFGNSARRSGNIRLRLIRR